MLSARTKKSVKQSKNIWPDWLVFHQIITELCLKNIIVLFFLQVAEVENIVNVKPELMNEPSDLSKEIKGAV